MPHKGCVAFWVLNFYFEEDELEELELEEFELEDELSGFTK